MSIKATIISQFEEVRRASKKPLRPLTDDLVLLDSGLDSLGLAILVTRLEDTLGLIHSPIQISPSHPSLSEISSSCMNSLANPVTSIRDTAE